MWTMRVIRTCCGKSPNPASYTTPINTRKYTIVASNFNIFINKPKQQILSTLSIQTNFLTRNISLFGSKNDTGISTSFAEKELDFTNYNETNGTDPTISIDPPIVEGIPQTFADLGLGGWDLPHHWVQSILEYLNVTMGVPWIPAIAVATLTLRLLAIPAYISMRGFVARSHNSQPEQVGGVLRAKPPHRLRNRSECWNT
uniref:Uncharacterized protein n=1 Tax=Ciona savignyi TaxID=51511 RepID=H2YKL0_CIOSA